MAQTCFLFGAGPFYGLAAAPQPGDLILAADGGYRHCQAAGLRPDRVLGDFDSLGAPPEGVPADPFPVEKDDTDTMLGLKHALNQGCAAVHLYGCTGGAAGPHPGQPPGPGLAGPAGAGRVPLRRELRLHRPVPGGPGPAGPGGWDLLPLLPGAGGPGGDHPGRAVSPGPGEALPLLPPGGEQPLPGPAGGDPGGGGVPPPGLGAGPRRGASPVAQAPSPLTLPQTEKRQTPFGCLPLWVCNHMSFAVK